MERPEGRVDLWAVVDLDTVVLLPPGGRLPGSCSPTERIPTSKTSPARRLGRWETKGLQQALFWKLPLGNGIAIVKSAGHKAAFQAVSVCMCAHCVVREVQGAGVLFGDVRQGRLYGVSLGACACFFMLACVCACLLYACIHVHLVGWRHSFQVRGLFFLLLLLFDVRNAHGFYMLACVCECFLYACMCFLYACLCVHGWFVTGSQPTEDVCPYGPGLLAWVCLGPG